MTGPGVSTFYTLGTGAALVSAANAFFTAIKGSFPTGLVWTFPAGGEEIDDNTGGLTGVWTGATAGTVAASGVPEHAQGVGARMTWRTAGIVGGRLSVGSTFLVPLCVNQYDPDGSIVAGAITGFNNAAATMVTSLAGDMVVLSRVTPAHSGTSHVVLSGTAPDRVSWLRSRRT